MQSTRKQVTYNVNIAAQCLLLKDVRSRGRIQSSQLVKLKITGKQHTYMYI